MYFSRTASFPKMSYDGSILKLSLLLTATILATAQTSYNSKSQICCNGTVHDKSGLGQMSCCGGEAYDSNHFRCCGCGQPQDLLLQNPFFGDGCFLGRTTIYDHRTQTCCDGEVVDKPDPSVEYGCCKGQLYDRSSHRCCDGRALEKRPDEQCCGDQVYDRGSQICCAEYGQDWDNFRIAARESKTTACCGLETFDFRTHVCCDDVVVPKKEGMDEKKSSSCCNGEPYDKTKQFCCRRTGKTGTNTHVYLESILYDHAEDGHRCCGTLGYDFHEEICCRNYTIPKPASAPRAQAMDCCGGQPITNSTTQTCVSDEIFERENRNFGVCAGKQYDRRTHWCCGQLVYDTRTHMCCARRVYERGSNLKCCYLAEEAYDATTHVCFMNAVKPLTDEGRAANHDAFCSPWYVRSSGDGLTSQSS